MLINDYTAKIQNTCAMIDAAESQILEIEKVEIVLTGLSSDFDGVITLASFSSEPLLFQCLVDILLEFESRQSRAATEIPFHANLVAFAPTPLVTD